MHTCRYFPLLLAVSVTCGALEARATNLAGSGDPFTFNFDENGNGLLDLRTGGGFKPNPGFLAPDPTQTGNPLVLTYLLPAPTVNGDIRIWEDASQTVLGDVIRFTDANGDLTGQTADRMIFYSDVEATNVPPLDLADTGFPASLLPNDGGGLVEVGPEGNNGFQWAPGGVWDNVYNGISDIPEPGTLSLCVLGASAWLMALRRRKRSKGAPKLNAGCLGICLLALPVTRLVAQPVVDVIPNQFSGETAQNAEPSIAVSPNVSQILIGSFGTLPGRPAGTSPYFITIGPPANQWGNFDNLNHGDTTLDWSQGGSAYVSVLGPAQIDVRQKLAASFGPPLPGSAYPPQDQPWLVVANVAGRDRFYVGINDGTLPPLNDVVWLYTDADPGGPTWRVVQPDSGGPLASGAPLVGDGVPVRLAASGNVVYVAFQRWDVSPGAGDAHGDIGVCRDVAGGSHNFMDPGKHGRPLAPAATGITIPFNATSVGAERLGSDLSIAVDPNDADKVYVAWAQNAGAAVNVHVAESDDGGETWREIYSTPAPSALPAVAVAQDATVGLLFTRLDGAGNLTTRFAQGLGSAAGPGQTTLSSFPNGNPIPVGAPYIGDYQDLQAVGNAFYGTFSAANDPKLNNFPAGVFFQRNVLVNGVLKSNFVLTANGSLADTNGLNLTNKWLQIPDATTNGLDVLATLPKVLADDFLCTTSGPITEITIWGSWLTNNATTNTSFLLALWSNVPADAAHGTPSHPGNLVWGATNLSGFLFGAGSYQAALYANVTNENFYDPETDTILGPDNQVWQYTFPIPDFMQFVQTNGSIYWLSATALPFDGTGTNISTTNTFGWKTSPTNWMDAAVFGDYPGTNWNPLVRPHTTNDLNLAFAIGAGPTVSIDPFFFSRASSGAPPTNGPPSQFTNAVVPQKWLQLPDTTPIGLDVLVTAPKMLADDFACTATGPITQIKIWGSWLSDASPDGCPVTISNLPCFCLGIWSDVPATNGLPSHPNQQLWGDCFFTNQYSFRIYTNLWIPGVFTNGVHEAFFDPDINAIIGLDNVIWEYTFDIPTNIAYVQTNGTIYWLSVIADCFDTRTNTVLFGWKTSPNHFKDDAVFIDLTSPVPAWQELRDPRTAQSLDLAFAVSTPVAQTNALPKWLQRPDLTPTGLDVLAGNAANAAGAGIRVVADDFLCQISGYVTDISIWGSWLNDQVDPGATFTLSFWGDVPAVGSNPSHPGNLLWQWTFSNGGYTSTLVSSGVPEGFLDPSYPTLLRGNDTQVYQYDFNVPAPAAFFQTNGNIYWLSVETCNTHVGLFGWKTCILNDRFGDDAVWTWLLPPSWSALVYPPGHPFAGLSMDMSFLLGTVQVADPPGPNVTQASPPALSAIASGNGSLTISWTASSAVLQSALELTGPWTDVSGAASPYLVPTDKPRCFYRVYVP